MLFHVKMVLLIVWAGVILDFIMGDPRWLYHPVVAIGKLISVFEKMLRKIFPKTKIGERIAGTMMVLLVISISVFVPMMILHICYKIHVVLGIALEIFWCGQLLATKSLKSESMKVYDELKKDDLEGGRRAVSMIVGRDTKELTVEGVVKAAVETVAENSSDGVVAPLFYMMIGGAPLGFLYKAINTMDSMVAYKNEKYRYFGTTAAILDDIANFIPARLSAIFMITAAFFSRMDGKNAWKIFKRDRLKHASPNSAQTESVMAGALDVQLAGDAWYFGELHKKDYIGDPIRSIEVEDIKRANHLLYVTVVLSAVVFGAIRAFIMCFV